MIERLRVTVLADNCEMCIRDRPWPPKFCTSVVSRRRVSRGICHVPETAWPMLPICFAATGNA